MLRTLFASFGAKQTKSRSRSKSSRPMERLRVRLQLERLEDRTVPTTLYASDQTTLAAAINYFDQHGPGSTNDVIQCTTDIYLTSQLPAVTCNLTIKGGSPNRTAVGGSGSGYLGFPVFVLLGNANTVMLQYLTIQWGSAPNPGGLGNSSGGGVYSNVNLTMQNCWVSNCFANVDGGGVLSDSANLTLTSCTFMNDMAGTSGGAVYFVSGGIQNLNVASSFLDYNIAQAGSGGAIFYNANGQVSIDSTTISQNFARGTNGDGGALCAYADTVSITFGSGADLENNTARDWGGAVWVYVQTEPCSPGKQ
jgi:hypothetical protein